MATVENITAAQSSRTTARQKEYSFDQQQRFWGWVFLSPWILGFLTFTFIPIFASFIFTFTDFELSNPGATNFFDLDTYDLDNYRKLFNDPLVEHSLKVTFRFALPAVALSMIIPIAIATLLNAKFLWGKRYFRTLFYMPYMVPAVSAIFIWSSFLSAETGWLNRLLALVGVNGPNWTNDINFV